MKRHLRQPLTLTHTHVLCSLSHADLSPARPTSQGETWVQDTSSPAPLTPAFLLCPTDGHMYHFFSTVALNYPQHPIYAVIITSKLRQVNKLASLRSLPYPSRYLCDSEHASQVALLVCSSFIKPSLSVEERCYLGFILAICSSYHINLKHLSSMR